MGVEVIGAGMDWNNPYSCKQWSEKFNQANLQSDLPLYDPALTDALSPEINWAFLIIGTIPFILIPVIYVSLSFSQTWFIIANDENISG